MPVCVLQHRFNWEVKSLEVNIKIFRSHEMYNHVFLFCHSSILIAIDVISIGKKKSKTLNILSLTLYTCICCWNANKKNIESNLERDQFFYILWLKIYFQTISNITDIWSIQVFPNEMLCFKKYVHKILVWNSISIEENCNHWTKFVIISITNINGKWLKNSRLIYK